MAPKAIWGNCSAMIITFIYAKYAEMVVWYNNRKMIFWDDHHHSFTFSPLFFSKMLQEVTPYHGSIAKRPGKEKGQMEKTWKAWKDSKGQFSSERYAKHNVSEGFVASLQMFNKEISVHTHTLVCIHIHVCRYLKRLWLHDHFFRWNKTICTAPVWGK